MVIGTGLFFILFDKFRLPTVPIKKARNSHASSFFIKLTFVVQIMFNHLIKGACYKYILA